MASRRRTSPTIDRSPRTTNPITMPVTSSRVATRSDICRDGVPVASSIGGFEGLDRAGVVDGHGKIDHANKKPMIDHTGDLLDGAGEVGCIVNAVAGAIKDVMGSVGDKRATVLPRMVRAQCRFQAEPLQLLSRVSPANRYDLPRQRQPGAKLIDQLFVRRNDDIAIRAAGDQLFIQQCATA